MDHIASIEFHADTWGAGFTLWYDGVGFTPTTAVVDRNIFYNNSRWDAVTPAAGEADDQAIAISPHQLEIHGQDPHMGKTALLPGQMATFQNYTSYDRGINGIMVDVANLAAPQEIGVDDFAFFAGNDDEPANWLPAARPQHHHGSRR